MFFKNVLSYHSHILISNHYGQKIKSSKSSQRFKMANHKPFSRSHTVQTFLVPHELTSPIHPQIRNFHCNSQRHQFGFCVSAKRIKVVITDSQYGCDHVVIKLVLLRARVNVRVLNSPMVQNLSSRSYVFSEND